jgi:hypothetical protein
VKFFQLGKATESTFLKTAPSQTLFPRRSAIFAGNQAQL